MKLLQYADAFEEQGYDDLEYLRELDVAALKGVAQAASMKPGHAARFRDFLLGVCAGWRS